MHMHHADDLPQDVTPGTTATALVDGWGEDVTCLEVHIYQEAARFFGCLPGELELGPYEARKESATWRARVSVTRRKDV